MKRRTFLTTAGAGLAVAAIGPSYAQVPTLKVGSTPTGVPFTFLDTATNTIQGIMVDLITEIGKDAGFNVAVEPMQFSALIGALTSSRIDLISAAMFATAARKEVIDFSEPVYTYGEGLFVPKADTTNYTAIAELKGKVAGVQVGTAFVKPLQDAGVFSEVKIYDTIPDIMRDVNAGRVAAGFADFPIVAYNLQLGRFPDVRLVRSYKAIIPGSVAIGVRKSDKELLAKINTSLAKLQANGTVKRVLGKWGQE
ncbi:amino acid ABC transporter substrate-binding protein [Phreatobacter aquaticus]|uniref:Amino acid ABC transporter substrate-binding protein n=1 Tax=Phreatobacter aquaticus TaxID=2570229 RepID=A0A4D7QKB8_9HYPH|nr:ABC transporter substrate-binding protein [Phreatobacter aquaticus]QCK87535.1 amino acid ABC transporter substrate-binding protein [Phreatobacter aquaticus]